MSDKASLAKWKVGFSAAVATSAAFVAFQQYPTFAPYSDLQFAEVMVCACGAAAIIRLIWMKPK